MSRSLVTWVIVFLLARVEAADIYKIVILTEQESGPKESAFKGGLRSSRGDIELAVTSLDMDRMNEEASYKKLCEALKKGVSLLLDVTYSGWPKCRDLCAANDVPYLAVDFTIRSFVQVVDQYLRTLRNATDAAFIFQNEIELDQSLHYLVAYSTLRLMVLNQLGPNSIRKLQTIRPTPSYFVIIADSNELPDLFNAALSTGLVFRSDTWVLVQTDFKPVSYNLNNLNCSVTQIKLEESLCCKFMDLKEDCACPDNFKITDKFLELASQLIFEAVKTLKDMETPWEPKEVDCGTKGSRGQISSEFQKVIEKLVGNSSVLKFEEDFKRLHYQTYFEFRSFNRSTPPELAPFATSESADIQVHNDSDIKPLRRFFRVGTTLAIPWSYPSTDPDTGLVRRDAMGNEIWEGYCIELVEKLAEDMKFDYQLVIKESFGKRSPNGTWSGLVGDLATGQIDLISTGLTMTSEREEVIDFVPPYFDQTGITIVIRKGIRKTTIFKFMTVLKLEVWLSIVAALIMTAVLLCLLDKYSPYSAQNNPKLYPYECRKFTLKESFWFALTSFTPQGGGETPKSCSARVLVSAYWLFVVLMLATFTANLAAFLTVERMQSPVQSLEQLAKQSRIAYSVVNGSSTHQYFKNMKFAEDTLYRVWKEITLNASSDQSQYRVWDYPIKEQYGHILYAIEQGGPVPNASVGFQRVIDSENGEFALIHDSAEIKYEVSRNCNLTEVGEIFAEQPYALAVQQGSRLQEEISRNILDLQKDRFFEILTAKYWNSSQRGQCSDADDNEGITLESLGGVFIATICGLILAMITLSFEVYFHKRKKRTQTTPVASGGAESKNPVGAGPTKLMYAKEFESAVMRNRREFTEAWKKGGNNIQFITVQPRSHLY